MEVNRPDLGVFKGMALQKEAKTHKRNYPSVDNQHQFDHQHPRPLTDMQSMSRRQYQKPTYIGYQKAARSSNQSSLVLGQDKPQFSSVAQSSYQRHEDYRRSELVRKKEARLILGEEAPVYKSVAHDQHCARTVEPEKNINYKLQAKRFDPILGTQRTEEQVRKAGGYESFNPLRPQVYQAVNHTRMPQRGEHFDIITGRKLPF